MTTHRVLSHEEWIEARRQDLAREKEFSEGHPKEGEKSDDDAHDRDT